MIYDQGDVLPELIVTTAERVQPGEIYWGTTMLEGSARKGWLIESEGIPIPDGAQVQQFTVHGVSHGWVKLCNLTFRDPATLVLVQRRR